MEDQTDFFFPTSENASAVDYVNSQSHPNIKVMKPGPMEIPEERIKREVLLSKAQLVLFVRCVFAFLILIWIFMLLVAIFVVLLQKAPHAASSSDSFRWYLQAGTGGEQQRLQNNDWVFTLSSEGSPVVINTTSGQVFYLTKQIGTQLTYNSASGLLVLTNDVVVGPPWQEGVPSSTNDQESKYVLKLSETGSLVISSEMSNVPVYTFPFLE